MKANLYVVDGPLQLLNAIEAKTKFSSEGDLNILIIRYILGDVNKRQLNNCLNLTMWNQVIQLEPFLINFTTYIKTLCLVKRLKRNRSLVVKYFFMGGFYYQANHFFKEHLKPEYSFLLDDGNASIRIQKEIDGGIKFSELFSKRSQRFLKEGLSRLLGLKSPTYLRYNFFSFFDLMEVNGLEQVSNEFRFLGERLSEKKFNEEKVYFLGAPLVEMKIVSKDNYWNSVLQIQKYYVTLKKEFIYIKHRREVEKISGIMDGFKIRFVTFDNPIELEMLFSSDFPRSIGSFYSTALMSLHQLYSGLDVKSFKLNKEFLSVDLQSRIESIYQYYKIHIKVIDLN